MLRLLLCLLTIQGEALMLGSASMRAPPLHATMMAGFGPAPKLDKKAKKAGSTLSMKRQWDRYKALVSSDGTSKASVFARPRDASDWAAVGTVAFSKDTSVEGAVTLHKRLILEHAVRVKPVFAPKARDLEVGLAVGNAAPVALAKAEAADVKAAGFEGLPDATARYYRMSGDGGDDLKVNMDAAASKGLKRSGF